MVVAETDVALVMRALPDRTPKGIGQVAAQIEARGERFFGSKWSWAWIALLAVSSFGGCAAQSSQWAVGFWSLPTTWYVHLIAAPIFAFGSSALHQLAGPEFDPLLRAGVMTGIIITLDALVVAPLFERSFAMFQSVIGHVVAVTAIFPRNGLAEGLIRYGAQRLSRRRPLAIFPVHLWFRL